MEWPPPTKNLPQNVFSDLSQWFECGILDEQVGMIFFFKLLIGLKVAEAGQVINDAFGSDSRGMWLEAVAQKVVVTKARASGMMRGVGRYRGRSLARSSD